MLLNTTNLEVALRSERKKSKSENIILDEVKAILLENETRTEYNKKPTSRSKFNKIESIRIRFT